MPTNHTTRRDVLKTTGAAGVTGLTFSLAGCIGDDDEDPGTPGPTPDDDVELTDPVPELDFVIPTESANAERHEMSMMIASNLQDIGIELNVQPVDFETHVTLMLVEHDFDLTVLGWGGTPERIDPHTFIFDLHHGSMTGEGQRNSPGYDNPEYNEIAEAQFLAVDMEERQQLVHEAQEILARDQPRTYIANEDAAHPYNADNFPTTVSTMGEGLNSFWNICYAEPASGVDTMRFGYPTEVTSLSPLVDMATPDRQWVRLLYDRLYRVTDEGIPQPWAAADEPEFEDDGETVTVEIRDGMTFHDGEPVTPEVVKWSFEFFGEHSATYGGRMGPVEEVTVTGDNAVTFHLEEAQAPFVANTLAQIYIFPQHIWEDVDEPTEHTDETYTGSGPYQFHDWRLEEALEFHAFEDHFEPPNVDRVIRVPGADTSSLVRQLEAGEMDMVGAFPSPTALNRIEDDPVLDFETFRAIGFVKIAYNHRREVTQDVHFRRACSYCAPKQIYVDDIRDGFGTVTHTPIAEVNEFWHNPDVEQFTLDLDAARNELREAGYGWDDDGRLHYTADHEPRMFLD